MVKDILEVNADVSTDTSNETIYILFLVLYYYYIQHDWPSAQTYTIIMT